jgi:hypothetical protein
MMIPHGPRESRKTCEEDLDTYSECGYEEAILQSALPAGFTGQLVFQGGVA